MTAYWVLGSFGKNGDPLDPNVEEKFHGNVTKGYSRDYLKPDFRSLGPLVSKLQGFE